MRPTIKNKMEKCEIDLNIPTLSGSIRKRARNKILTTRLSACFDKCKINDRDDDYLLQHVSRP